MTYTYIINVSAPITVNNDKMVSYNKYPMVCISKKDITQVLEIEQVRTSIKNTLELVGKDLFDKAVLHIRIVDNKARITDSEEPINKLMEQWK